MTTGTRTAELLIRVSPPARLRARRVTLTELLAGGVAAERIAGKTVVIGFETPGESFRLAHGLERTTAFGYELHASAINVLASGRTPTFAPPGVQALLAGIFATFGAAFGVRFRSLGSGRTAALSAALLALYLAAAVSVVAAEDVLLNSAYDIGAFAFAFALFRHLARRWLR
jgi:CHASE2 domain-containing sensor protein